MPPRTISKKVQKKRDHYHFFDIPAKFLPKRSEARAYKDEVSRLISSLEYTNQEIQHSAQVCCFDLGAILKKKGFRPKMDETFRLLRDFTYHYENYCYRMYACREKILLFLNAAMQLDYDEHDVRLKIMLRNPEIKRSHISRELEQLQDSQYVGGIIKDRNAFTHKLFYGQKFDHYFRPTFDLKYKTPHSWFADWRKEILSRAKKADKAHWALVGVSNNIATKLVEHNSVIEK